VSGVVLGQIAFLSPKDLHDAPARLVAGRLASRSFVADRLRLIGAEEVLELVAVILTASCQSAQTWAKVSSAPVAIALPFFLSADGLARVEQGDRRRRPSSVLAVPNEVRLRQSDENFLSTLFKVTSSRVSSVDTLS
jgi:hypothetical protein